MKPIQLKGFRRTDIPAGEKKIVEMELMLDQLANYEGGKWKISPGEYEILIGSSSNDIYLRQPICLTGDEVIKEYRDNLLM